MTDADSAYGLAFAACELQDELELVLDLGLEDGRRCASECATAILKHGIGGGSVDGDGLETTIEFVKRNVR
jgi:hypothetical protein